MPGQATRNRIKKGRSRSPEAPGKSAEAPGRKKDKVAKRADPEVESPKPVRLVVQSIGTASFSVLGALRQVSTLTEQELAARLFRAPAELFSGVPRETAEKAAEILRGAGLEVDILPENAALTPGDADHDVALSPVDYTRMTDVLGEVMRFLGVDAKTARRILCASPTILVGGVSAATVAALGRRFGPLGVELSVSRPSSATFDLVVVDCAPSVRARIVETLRAAGAPVAAAGDAASPLVAPGLDKATAERIWDRFGRKNPSLRILDRAFERFDVRLDACPPGAARDLVEVTGMPESAALKVLGHLPIIVQQSLSYDAAEESLARLSALGARAAIELATLQTFSMVIEAAPDRRKAAQVLRALLDLPEDQGEALLRTLPARIEGPLTHTHARWLQAELKAAGAVAKRVRR